MTAPGISFQLIISLRCLAGAKIYRKTRILSMPDRFDGQLI